MPELATSSSTHVGVSSTVGADYLEAAARFVEPAKQRSYARMELYEGARALDVGCGPATDTLALAARVGESGFVAGVDADKEMVLAAERKAHEAGLSQRVRHYRVDALELPFSAGSFDATRSERTFQHLGHPEHALAEMARVTRPGGRVVVLDTDWGTASLDTPYTHVERILSRLHAERLVRNGFAGRTLYRLFRELGLAQVEVESCTVIGHSWKVARLLARLDEVEAIALAEGLLQLAEVQDFRAAAEAADAAGTFFSTTTLILASGRVPQPGGAA